MREINSSQMPKLQVFVIFLHESELAATAEEEARESKHEHHGFSRRQYVKGDIL
jgi:hypothetical protein